MNKNSPAFLDIGQGLFIMLGLPRIPTWKNETRPKNAKKGTMGFNTQTHSLEYWNGTSWYAASMTTA